MGVFFEYEQILIFPLNLVIIHFSIYIRLQMNTYMYSIWMQSGIPANFIYNFTQTYKNEY